jgi:KDO2-lipid IV(A) lauroyltransferase
MTTSQRSLEAPHRRLERGSRLAGKLVVWGYRAASGLLGRLPIGLSSALIGTGAQLGYLAWPARRRWVNANFAHVLRTSPDDPRVRRLALRAYRGYGRYLAEVMTMPRLTVREAETMLSPDVLDGIEEIWRGSRGGLIFAVAHVGNNDMLSVATGHRGWPIHALADDSAYQELFEDFRRVRERWGAKIIAWRNLRDIYAVLRRREMLALLIDWGYRPDGIPVRLFGEWTTLPAGPAVLAAKTGSRILPVTTRRVGRQFDVTWPEPIEVRSTDPAELVRATQAIADALEQTIATAPEQWYSFKPLWPASAEEQAALAARAEAALAGQGAATGPSESDDPAALATASSASPGSALPSTSS